jgi:hypothetical protein
MYACNRRNIVLSLRGYKSKSWHVPEVAVMERNGSGDLYNCFRSSKLANHQARKLFSL